jgi:hypothetical protein
MLRKRLVGAAIAVLALGSAAMADNSQLPAIDNSPAVDSSLPVTAAQNSSNPIYGDDTGTATPAPAQPPAAAPPAAAPPAAPSAPEGAIMWGLDQIGIGKTLEAWNFSITGYAEGGYFYDLTEPNNAPGNGDRALSTDRILFPGDYKNDAMLNQLQIDFQRTVDTSKWDIGFNIDGFYGRDAVYTHANGILDNRNKHGDSSPDNDFDLEQAYAIFAIPLGSGITINAGKFDTLMGYETINPTTNAFYTHSYLFSYAVPLTQTGVTFGYNITQALTITAGFTRGWNQATSDNNGAIDFLGQLGWQINSAIKLTINLSEGPESTHDNHDYWTVPEAILNWQIADQLGIGIDAVYGDANAIAQWYGAAGYLMFDPFMNQFAKLNLRAEYYHDGRGFTVGTGGSDVNYFEGTLGVAITPTPNINLLQTLTFRPEIRVDLADQAVFDNAHHTQLTAAVDAYIKF